MRAKPSSGSLSGNIALRRRYDVANRMRLNVRGALHMRMPEPQ